MRAGEHAVRAEHRRLDLHRGRDAEHDDVARSGERGDARGLGGALGHQIVHRLAVAVAAHAHMEPGAQDVGGDAVAHEAEADAADSLGHDDLPV